MKFNLEHKDYKTEKYVANLGQGLSAIVTMFYHTHLKYWDISYYIGYNLHYRSELIFGKSYINSRKEARKIAQEIMNHARPDDWKTKLNEFYQGLIRESISKTPKFINI